MFKIVAKKSEESWEVVTITAAMKYNWTDLSDTEQNDLKKLMQQRIAASELISKTFKSWKNLASGLAKDATRYLTSESPPKVVARSVLQIGHAILDNFIQVSDPFNPHASKEELAFKFFAIAAKTGSKEAKLIEADCYARGLGVKQDTSKAITYLEDSKSGDAFKNLQD